MEKPTQQPLRRSKVRVLGAVYGLLVVFFAVFGRGVSPAPSDADLMFKVGWYLGGTWQSFLRLFS